jgi:translation initiation factor IF-3
MSQQSKHRINQQITAPKVRLVVEGQPPVEISRDEALKTAKEQGLDLVEVASKANPPVCKLMNYGKFLYMQSKQERLHKAKQKKTETKAIRLSLKIEKHDMQVKAKKINQFLDQGHKVKLDLYLRGREKAFRDEGLKKLEIFLSLFPEEVYQEQPIKKTPQGFFTLLAKKQ